MVDNTITKLSVQNTDCLISCVTWCTIMMNSNSSYFLTNRTTDNDLTTSKSTPNCHSMWRHWLQTSDGRINTKQVNFCACKNKLLYYPLHLGASLLRQTNTTICTKCTMMFGFSDPHWYEAFLFCYMSTEIEMRPFNALLWGTNWRRNEVDGRVPSDSVLLSSMASLCSQQPHYRQYAR